MRTLNKLLGRIERIACYYQGKGWGGGSIKKEVSSMISLLGRKEVKLIIDIGGNKGRYTEELLQYFPDSKIIIFEPAKSNIEIIKKKFIKNKNISIQPFAISKDASEATLFSDEDGSGLASLTKRRLGHFGIEFDHQEIITKIRFEDFWINELNRQHIQLCKIDIEGHELDALNGFGEALEHIDLIQFEFGGCNIDTRTFFQDFWYFFQEHSFSIHRITPIGIFELNSYSESLEFYTTTNYIAKKITDD